MEDRQKIIEKLVKIKALAERGIGGEQQTAQVMYATLKEKYKVTDAEIEKAAAVPVDISEIDLKKFWGIAFQLAAVAKTLQEETDICTACPYTYTDEICFQRMTRICGKTGKTAITSMCPVISIIAANAEHFWIWTNGSEKKNQRQQVKN